MTLFEAGIMSKMTTDEYRNLPEHSRRSEPVTESDRGVVDFTGDTTSPPQGESTKLQPVTLRMLRGAFLLLGIGHIVSALTLAIEVQVYRRRNYKSHKSISRESTAKIIGRFGIILRRLNEARRRVALRVAVTAVRAFDRALGPEA